MKISFRKDDQEVIEEIRNGSSRVMERLYLQYRKEFLRWSVGKYNISEEDALDHYQDTMAVFFENVMNGNIEKIGSTIKTYLFGVGKNKIRQQFDKESREVKHTEFVTEHYRFLANDEGLSEKFELARHQAKEMFKSLGEACREILKLFYFEKKSMREIANKLGHKNEGVSRTTKKRCLEKLRSEIKNVEGNG